MTEFMEATASLPQTIMGSALFIIGMFLLGRTMRDTLFGGRWLVGAGAVMYGAAFAALTLGAFLLDWL